MKKVILLRHGKSSWKDPDLPDHDRPLNQRGRTAAPVMGEWLAKRQHRPDVVLVSSAKRTQETYERLAKQLDGLPEPEIERGLYHATPAALRDRLGALDDRWQTVMLIGHNPGLAAFARKLSNGEAPPRCRRAFEHFPTAAAAVLEFDVGEWRKIAFGEGRFVDFAVPRELMEN